MNDEIFLSAKGIHKIYLTGKSQKLHVLKGIDLSIRKGEILSIVGPSGVGKSTLLHILGALDRPTEGSVYIDSIDVFHLSDIQLAKFRNRHIGFVFQFHHLLPEFTALENVAMPGFVGRGNPSQILQRAKQLLCEVGMGDRLHHKPAELSGGEQQRVAFARALINDPLLVLADEPSGNLDRANSLALHELMWRMVKEKGKSFIVVTHNLDLAYQADRVIELFDGRIKQ